VSILVGEIPRSPGNIGTTAQFSESLQNKKEQTLNSTNHCADFKQKFLIAISYYTSVVFKLNNQTN